MNDGLSFSLGRIERRAAVDGSEAYADDQSRMEVQGVVK